MLIQYPQDQYDNPVIGDVHQQELFRQPVHQESQLPLSHLHYSEIAAAAATATAATAATLPPHSPPCRTTVSAFSR